MHRSCSVGRILRALNRYYNGVIDEFALFNRGLSQDEVKEIQGSIQEILAVEPDEKLPTTWGLLKQRYDSARWVKLTDAIITLLRLCQFDRQSAGISAISINCYWHKYCTLFGK